MPLTTLSDAYAVIDAYPADWKALVRDRRTTGRSMLAEADTSATALKAGDAEAIAYLQAVAAANDTPGALRTAINQKLAVHARRKQELNAEV